MTLNPLIAFHMTCALGALAVGPVALWARLGRRQQPRLHRAAGYAWVTLMLLTALSAVFIRSRALPNIGGYSLIHLFIPLTLVSLFFAFQRLFAGDVERHRKIMRKVYYGACVGAGVFALAPNRYLGQLVLGQWLGWL